MRRSVRIVVAALSLLGLLGVTACRTPEPTTPGKDAKGEPPPLAKPDTGGNTTNPPKVDQPSPNPSSPPTTGCQPGQASDYFPYHQGTQATYQGTGNEYASYKIKVLHESGNKVEWRKENGGTVAAEVFQVTPQQVTRIYMEGEAYNNTSHLNSPPNQSEPILKGPIQVGTQWTSGNTTYTIQSVNASVQAMNQTLNCIVTVQATAPASVTLTHWHKQYGLVLSTFNPTNNPVESRLSSFTP